MPGRSSGFVIGEGAQPRPEANTEVEENTEEKEEEVAASGEEVMR
jgi:hypothetical protein